MGEGVEIRTARLLLRPLHESDEEQALAMFASDEIREYFPTVLQPSSLGEALEQIRTSWRTRGFGYLAVERPDQDDFIGIAGLNLTHISPLAPAVEVGWLLEPQHWNKGLATEAAQGLIGWAWRHTDLVRLVGFAPVANLAAQAVFRKAGMVADHSASFDHPRLPHDHPHLRHVVYRIDKPV